MEGPGHSFIARNVFMIKETTWKEQEPHF